MGKCFPCSKSGDPYPSRKFTFSRIHLHFNDRVYFDIFYWLEDEILHVVDFYTGYSEAALLGSNKAEFILRQLENVWVFRHGDPLELWADQEFNRGVTMKWAKDRGIKLRDLPARRHNKAGPVERKNRVLKNALERLDNDPKFAKLPIVDRMIMAAFSGDILYGNRFASSFELVRGYTPNIAGSGKVILPAVIREAH